MLRDDGDEEDQTSMIFCGISEHQQPTPLSAAAGDKASPDTILDDGPLQNQQMLPQEGRGKDYSYLLEGGGNGCVFDPLPSASPYPDVPWVLIEAFLMDDGDEEDQTPMNFSGILEHQQPMPLRAAASDKASPTLFLTMFHCKISRYYRKKDEERITTICSKVEEMVASLIRSRQRVLTLMSPRISLKLS